jgi:hypothetical protein
MRVLTKRFQSVQVATLSALRERLETISGPDFKFAIEKVRGDRVAVRREDLTSREKAHPIVILPAYPTGHDHDKPANPNVVLDPLEFINADTWDKRDVFAPLLGHDVLEYYDRLHSHGGLSVTRCC